MRIRKEETKTKTKKKDGFLLLLFLLRDTEKKYYDDGKEIDTSNLFHKEVLDM
jgi:hypothetical protein